MNSFDVFVIGQGYAGLSVARYAHEQGLKVINAESFFAGGLVVNINDLDPAPEGASACGSELVSGLAMENMDSGIAMVDDAVARLVAGGSGWKIETTGGQTFTARHVVAASGARLRKLGVPGEEEYFGRGVSECADCDGPMFSGQSTVIVGGGDSAFQEALALSHFAADVTVLVRAATPRARADLVSAVKNEPKITVRTEVEVLEIEGEASGVTGVSIKTAGGIEKLACAGVFVFVGLAPSADYLPENVERDAQGAVVTSESLQTAQPGLWALGAVRSGFGGRLSDADDEARRIVSSLQ